MITIDNKSKPNNNSLKRTTDKVKPAKTDISNISISAELDMYVRQLAELSAFKKQAE